MTIVTHYAVGAGVYMVVTKAVCHVLGVDHATSNLLAGFMGANGGAIGAAPDGIDWLAWKFFGVPRWQLYNMFHKPDGELRKLLQYTLAGWLHIEMDKFVHPPKLPLLTDPDCPEELKVVVLRTKWLTLTVRDVLYLSGEQVAWVFIVLTWYMSLKVL